MTNQKVSDAVLMTLAGIAYGAPNKVADYIGLAEPTATGWAVTWLPDDSAAAANFAFIATETSSAQSVLAIRGTYPNPFSPAYWDDASQDSPFGDMAAWPGQPTGTCVSKGTNEGLTNLLALTQTSTDGSKTSMLDAIAALPAGNAITVTGHSLGGTLAPVVALKIAETYTDRDVSATSFAGMTPGNAAFAALFGSGTVLDGKVRRVFNTLDTVSYGWDKVTETKDFYEPAPQGGPIVADMLTATADLLALGGYDYAPVGEPVPLKGVLSKSSIDCSLVAYVFENLHQHLPDTYLSLLDAPPLPFSLLFGNLVAPRDHPASSSAPSTRLPVVHL